ncbi:MaoC family dehydratase N-terminal domain-containing protein [Agrobacterium larrymoorei]|uniref:Acyl-CoA dehydrogenase n=1 Tax=Agrobacterium larrymoorei TaxID=160699 RepID=A0A4D7E508_9HYPH|nr:MaoC family dehydratase N-terminal domain-containing protein [Agrobacterium larrymoorei]QCJ01157.1 acyl-CoA dehydrogenase [Agrobacterium larrymoorei]QYA10167.1 MaoC family dehydratase N-terminal domain-containing protein [Agrobacterium larrymoorei]
MSADPADAIAEDYSGHVGRTEQRFAFIDPDRVAALANTFDLQDIPAEGEGLPAAWHWIFFNPFVRRSEVGADGHPRKGGFLPDVGLPRRMWAGGRLRYHAPLSIGAKAERSSEILSVTPKSGKAGRLVFVTVRHRVTSGGFTCIEEEQNIVYREPPQPGAAAPPMQPAPIDADWSEAFTPDPVLLFRYSALTSNGHRIHYDTPYARNEEGYPDLVVHGPLISSLLQGLAQRARPDQRLVRFDFRAVSPLFVDRAFHIEGSDGDAVGLMRLWVKGPEGNLAMTAEAEFQ